MKLVQETAHRLSGKKVLPLSIHAGAEANIYANKKNARGEILQPLLLGVAKRTVLAATFVFRTHHVDKLAELKEAEAMGGVQTERESGEEGGDVELQAMSDNVAAE